MVVDIVVVILGIVAVLAVVVLVVVVVVIVIVVGVILIGVDEAVVVGIILFIVVIALAPVLVLFFFSCCFCCCCCGQAWERRRATFTWAYVTLPGRVLWGRVRQHVYLRQDILEHVRRLKGPRTAGVVRKVPCPVLFSELRVRR